MEQYISKAAVVAKINKLKVHSEEAVQEFGREGYMDNVLFEQSKIRICEKLLLFLDTLEAKEVDFGTLGILADHLIACDAHGISPKYNGKELDLLEKMSSNKAQKGE